MPPTSFAESVPQFLWHLLVLHMDLKIWVKTLVCQVKLNKQNVKVGDRENEHVCLRAMFWIKRKLFWILEPEIQTAECFLYSEPVTQFFRLVPVVHLRSCINTWGINNISAQRASREPVPLHVHLRPKLSSGQFHRTRELNCKYIRWYQVQFWSQKLKPRSK